VPGAEDWLSAFMLGRQAWKIIKGSPAEIIDQGDDEDMANYGPIKLYAQRFVVDASDVARGTLDLFCTPNYGAGGRQHGPSPGSPYMYEEWQILGAVSTLMTPTAGTREGTKIRIQAISGDIAPNQTWDIILADTIQRHFHYASFTGPLIVPYGIYSEVDNGGFELGDVFALVVNYRQVLAAPVGVS